MPLFDDRALGALERGMDGMWLKQQIASHNIANVETPGYKAKKVEFRDVLYETAQNRAYIQTSGGRGRKHPGQAGRQ